MRTKRAVRPVIWMLVLFLAVQTQLMAQDETQGTPAEPEAYVYTQEQLDSLLAPIALYPDVLLSQILMASTYPLEVVEADRWVKENPQLTGDGLDRALLEKSWDVSVKSLCHYPRVLASMSQNLQQTSDLGNAFLGQQDQVMDTIQGLRAKARAQGNLRSTDRQRVVVEDQDITIEPAAPDVVYVPAYDPCWVYGPWWYPACSPLWFWYPDLVVGVGFFFGPPYFVGPIDFWCGFHWHRHSIFVNVGKTAFVNRIGVTRMHGGVEVWRHDPIHRRGLPYSSASVGRQFGQAPRPGVDARRAFRGFTPEGGRNLAPVPRSEGLGGGPRMERREAPNVAPRQFVPQGGPAIRGGPRGGTTISAGAHSSAV